MSSATLPVLATSTDVDELVASSDTPVLVSFGAEWCPPCHVLEPVLADIAAEHEGIVVRKADIDGMPDLVRRYDLMSAPTMILFDGGEPVLRLVGARPKASVLEALASYL